MKVFFNSLDVGDVTLISNTFINEHMVRANGEYVKVYLYLSCHAKEELNVDMMAEILCLTYKDVIRAVDYWKKAGVIKVEDFKSVNSSPAEPDTALKQRLEEEWHDKSKIDLIRLENNEEFATLIYCAQKYLAKPFSSTDTISMAYMYDVLKMSSELIIYLIEICVQNKKTSMRYIETIALKWKSKGIDSVEKAKNEGAYFGRDVYMIMKAFGLNGRNPGRAEQEYIDKWRNEWRFSTDVILQACDKTIAAIQTPSFKYTDSILSGWLKEGVRKIEDIKNLDEIFIERSKKASKAGQYRAVSNKFNNFEQRDDDLDGAMLDRLNFRLSQS